MAKPDCTYCNPHIHVFGQRAHFFNGVVLKKKTLHASERDRPDIQKKHRLFRRAVRRIEPERLVFLDETGITTMRTLTYAWAPRGERAVGSVPTSWVTVTVIAALGWDGVRAPLAFPGPPTQRRSSLMWIRRW